MIHRLLRFFSTRKVFRRVAFYSIAMLFVLVEILVYILNVNDTYRDRFCYYFIIAAIVPLYALIHKKSKNLLLLFLVLLLIMSVLMFHVAFCVGNGYGFSVENLINLMSTDTLYEFFLLSPESCILVTVLIIVFSVMAMSLAFLVFWSLRPFPRNLNNLIITITVFGISIFFIIYFCYPLQDISRVYNLYRSAEKFLNYDKEFYREHGVQVTPLDDKFIEAKPGKNLVFIILESTELHYLDEKLFPGLLPNLKNFYNRSQQFENISMAPNATVTMGALYSMFTGCYLTPEHLTNGHNTVFKPRVGIRLSSLPKILHNAGYHQYFAAGHSANLVGTGAFIHEQKFDTVWFGVDMSERVVGGGSLRDFAVYEKAWEYFQHAAAQNKPFNLTLLTIDAHGPDGFYDPSTPAYPHKVTDKHRALFNAMYASDAALGKFLERLSGHPAYKDTCIVIVSDHLAHYYSSTGDILDSKPDRRLLFCIRNSVKEQMKKQVPGMTFDIAPTVLEALGVQHNYTFPLGKSLYAPQFPRRLRRDEMQTMAISAYIKLKSIVPQLLPVDISTSQKPYPMFNVGLIHMPVLFNEITDLPQKDEFIMLPIPENNIIDSATMLQLKGYEKFKKAAGQYKKFICITRNSTDIAEHCNLPQQDGFILYVEINGKRCVKFSPSFDELFISKAEIEKIMR